jgi:hypothetical protein
MLYLPLWCVVGLTNEVRIFVPYLLAGVPIFAKVLALETGLPLSGEETASAERGLCETRLNFAG